MVSMYLLGVCFAFGHHFYYFSLNMASVGNSQWPLRFGTAPAFVTQWCFVGAALSAYKQYAWYLGVLDTNIRATAINYWGYLEGTQTLCYGQPTNECLQLAALTLPFNNGPLFSHDPCPGASCTLTVSFDGPAYKCEDMKDFDGTTGQTLDDFPPKGQLLYTASHIQTEDNLDVDGVPHLWLFGLDRKVMKCTFNYAKYDVTLKFEDARMSVNDTQLDF
ncbi:hypothetical protein B0H63DRAFT_520593 [Podospora didyma]|uniref:Uncharacterized protein n=1 Tax=Podospora didyma TaxID=330526 RepID=A0AAE0NRS3_9PEZI|nr:hypothetical protein B0H63DRAFT_520593 [Podospora didyma]